MIIVFTIPATGLSACDPLMLLGAGGPLNTRAAQNAAPTLPIVALSDDMIGEGLTRSLAQPGGNTTGVSIFAPELDGKRQDFLIEAVPGASRMAALAGGEGGRRPPEHPAQSAHVVSAASDCRTIAINGQSRR
jgi:hypothetical protein